MANGFIIESSITATDVVAKNRDFVTSGTLAIAGGELVALTAPTVQGEDRWTGAAPAAGTLGGLWIAYNPSMHITEVGVNRYAGLSEDPRDYTNEPEYTATAFEPVVNDQFIISTDCVDSDSVVAAVAGDFLESKANQTQWTRVAQATGATAGSTAVQIQHTAIIPFPPTKGTIGMSQQAGYKVTVVQV